MWSNPLRPSWRRSVSACQGGSFPPSHCSVRALKSGTSAATFHTSRVWRVCVGVARLDHLLGPLVQEQCGQVERCFSDCFFFFKYRRLFETCGSSF